MVLVLIGRASSVSRRMSKLCSTRGQTIEWACIYLITFLSESQLSSPPVLNYTTHGSTKQLPYIDYLPNLFSTIQPRGTAKTKHSKTSTQVSKAKVDKGNSVSTETALFYLPTPEHISLDFQLLDRNMPSESLIDNISLRPRYSNSSNSSLGFFQTPSFFPFSVQWKRSSSIRLVFSGTWLWLVENTINGLLLCLPGTL